MSAIACSSPGEEAGVALDSATISLISIGDMSIPVRLIPITVLLSMIFIS
jgi:hypothetical protein